MEDGELKFHTLIDLKKEKDAMRRIRHMLMKICEILDKYEIDAIHMEKSIMKNNIDTVQKLSNLAGGIISAFIIVCLRVGLGQQNLHPQVILLILGLLLICADTLH